MAKRKAPAAGGSGGQEAALKAKAAETAREKAEQLVEDTCPRCGDATLSAVDTLTIERRRVHLLPRDVPGAAMEAWCVERGHRTYQTWGDRSAASVPKIARRTSIERAASPAGPRRVLVEHWCTSEGP